MKKMNKAQDKRYWVSFYPSANIEKRSVTIVLCKGANPNVKKLHPKHLKKGIFALESSA